MRVDANRPVRPASGRRDGKSGVGGAGSFSDMLGTEASSASAAAAPLGGIGALFALQEVPDATAERRQAIARGGELLDRLKDLQQGLLDGRIDAASLADLAATVRAARVKTDDPQLQDLLDQIELRAAVELAKLDRTP